MVSSVLFSSLSPNPNKTHQLLQSISGLGFFCGSSFLFYFKYWKSPLGSVGLPTLTALLPTANLFQGQHFFFFNEQLTLIEFLGCSAELEELFASVTFRWTVSFISHQIPSHIQANKAFFYRAELEPLICSLLHFFPLTPTSHQPHG